VEIKKILTGACCALSVKNHPHRKRRKIEDPTQMAESDKEGFRKEAGPPEEN